MARKAPDELSQRISITWMDRRGSLHPESAQGKVRSFQRSFRSGLVRVLAFSAFPTFLAMAGCGGSALSTSGSFSISPGTAAIDTNCTGCNSTGSSGTAAEQFSAALPSGAGAVNWTLAGGDASAGPGTINSNGQYTPPYYLTANSVQVTVTATIGSGSGAGTAASAALTITPGFLQPLSPENVVLGSGGTVTITGYLAEAGGSTGISYAVSGSPTGSSGGQGSVSAANCTRSSNAWTYCTVTYTAPGTVSSTAATYVVATVGNSSSATHAEVLLNTAGINSNPATHQTELTAPVLLGSSGGNNEDYDTAVQNGQTVITDCCGGTLGSLIQNSSGTQYLLSCNHVFARSDQASVGETIIQPGLIDNGCYPNGQGGTETKVGILTAWLSLSSSSTNVDAAIAQVNAGAVNSSGEIQELGLLQNGTLAAAPPGISSTGGNGENASLNLTVAKSGRTTGLTCASVSTVSLDVEVDYFKNCGETEPYLTKTYTNQIGIEGNDFSDAGDSGSLVVDAGNAEPVGLFFAGGENASGVSEGVANPAPTVLAELGAQEKTTYTFVGTTDHPVSCLNYGASTASAAQASTLTGPQIQLAQQALAQANMLVSPSTGILGAAIGKSSDRAGEEAVLLYVEQNSNVSVPQTIAGVRTEVIPATAQAVAAGTAPRYAAEAGALPSLAPGLLSQAIAAKQQLAQSLMKQSPAFFGVGVGQSLDNPREAALIIYVDRKQVPAALPPTIDGLRTRYVIMDRLHVTRSYLNGPIRSQSHCVPHPAAAQPDPFRRFRLSGLNLF